MSIYLFIKFLALPGLAWDFALCAILPLHPIRHSRRHPERSRGISGLFHPGAGAAPSPNTLSAKSSRVGFTTPHPPTYLRRREGLKESTVPALQPTSDGGKVSKNQPFPPYNLCLSPCRARMVMDLRALLLSAPNLQLLFSRNRIPRIVVLLVVHKTIQIISFREPGYVTRAMLMDPTHQTVRDSDIQRRLSLVGHHVNVKRLAGHEIPRLRSG